jgi:hypothetical protein
LHRCYVTVLALSALAGAVTLLPKALITGTPSTVFKTMEPFLMIFSVGLGFGLFIRQLRRSNMVWNDTLGNLAIILWTYLSSSAPYALATAHADADSRQETSKLNAIGWPERPDGDWRLGRIVDKGFVVIKLTADPTVSEIRLVPFGADVLIRPINQPIM